MASVKLHIRTGADLVAALRSELPGQRRAVLNAIASAPQTALAFEAVEGCDVLDELIRQVDTSTEPGDRMLLLHCLVAFRKDERVVGLGVRLLSTAEDAGVLVLAQSLLAEDLSDSSYGAVRQVLMETDERLRARLAGELLHGRDLPPREALRVALLTKGGEQLPLTVDAELLEAWLAELAGPFAVEAQLVLQEQGLSAFEILVSKWVQLSAIQHEWMLDWGSQSGWAATLPCLQHALMGGMLPLKLKALAVLERSPQWCEALQGEVDALAEHDDLLLRGAAIRAGAVPNQSWGEMLERSPQPEIRAAIAYRLGREHADGTFEPLLAALQDTDWRVRAEAARALALREGAAQQAEPLLQHPDPVIRAAAVQVVAAAKATA